MIGTIEHHTTRTYFLTRCCFPLLMVNDYIEGGQRALEAYTFGAETENVMCCRLALFYLHMSDYRYLKNDEPIPWALSRVGYCDPELAIPSDAAIVFGKMAEDFELLKRYRVCYHCFVYPSLSISCTGDDSLDWSSIWRLAFPGEAL